jgi:hypothetical protein
MDKRHLVKNLAKIALLNSTLVASSAFAMQAMDDAGLSEVVGQALFYTGYTAPNASTTSTNFGFYRLGIEASIALNANIKKLQLGCGGSKGAGCDIDIDNLSLSGVSSTSDGRVNSDATITNPFFEIAIKNPDNASTREIAGIRFSAAQVSGLLTAGLENTATPNGINSLSGYLQTGVATGTATTAARSMTYADTGLTIDGVVQGRLFGSSSGTTCVSGFLDPCYNISFTSDTYNLNLQSASVPITINSKAHTLRRQSSVDLTGSGTVGTINFSGQLTATVVGFLNLDKNVTGNITGLMADIEVTQSLGLIHKLSLNNPASLSVQRENVRWPGATVDAEAGWWLALEDTVDIGSVTPTNPVSITNAVLQQVVPIINQDLTNNPRNCGNLLTGCVGGSDLNVGNVNLSTNPNRFLDFPLTNLQLAAQNFAPNCYAASGLSFC